MYTNCPAPSSRDGTKLLGKLLPSEVGSFPPSYKEPLNARSSDRRCRPLPDRPRLQGLALPDPPRGDRGIRRRPASRAQPGRRSGARPGRLLRLRHAPGPDRVQRRPHHRPPLGEAHAGNDGHDDLALLRIVARRDPPRWQRDQGRRGRRLHRRRRRVGLEVQRGDRGGPRRRSQPEPPGQGRGPAQRIHRDGPHGRQRRQEVRGLPRRHGQVRAALAGACGWLAGVRLLRPRDRRREGPGRQRRRQGRRPTRLLDAREALRAARGLRRGRRDRRQLVPAERRGRCGARHVGHEGEGARPHAARPHRLDRDLGQRARVHGRRPDRCDQEGPRPDRNDDERHRRRRVERGVRSPGHPDHVRVRHPDRKAEHRTAGPSRSATRSA